MAYATNDGVNRYQTADGQVFTNEMDAQSHANSLGRSSSTTASAEVQQRERALTKALKKEGSLNVDTIIGYYNAGDWDSVINFGERKDIIFEFGGSVTGGLATAQFCQAAAYAHKGNYQKALDLMYSPYSDYTNSRWEEVKELIKKALEKAFGRSITDADYKKAEIDYFEQKLKEYVYHGWDTAIWIDGWEIASGRKMSQKDQVRIAGRPFERKGSSELSSPFSSKSGGGGFLGLFGKKK